jgi:hypothetical protein
VTWRTRPLALETPLDGNVDGTVATRDRASITSWAARRRADPATADVTRSGPETVDVHDGRAAIRFNFPGFGRFRPITWDEWFREFDRYGLTFVYEDSFDDAGAPSPRYRVVKIEDGGAVAG